MSATLTRPPPARRNIPLIGEHFDSHYASRELYTHGWDVLGDPKPWGEWTRQPDGSWVAYVDTVAGCARPGCENARFGCRWPYRDALAECEVGRRDPDPYEAYMGSRS